MVSVVGFEPTPTDSKSVTLPDYAIHCQNKGLQFLYYKPLNLLQTSNKEI